MTETSGETATQCAIAGRQRRFCRCNDRFLALRVFSFLIDRQLKHKVFHPLFIVLVAKDKLT